MNGPPRSQDPLAAPHGGAHAALGRPGSGMMPPELKLLAAASEAALPAVFGWFSSGRLILIKDGNTVCLSRDDLVALRQFLSDFE